VTYGSQDGDGIFGLSEKNVQNIFWATFALGGPSKYGPEHTEQIWLTQFCRKAGVRQCAVRVAIKKLAPISKQI
jgi:hypothetical protein